MNDKSQKNTDALIASYLDDELSQADAAELEAWLTSDEENAEEFLQAVAIHSSIRHQLSANKRLRSVDMAVENGSETADPKSVVVEPQPSPRRRFTMAARHMTAGVAIGVAFVVMSLSVMHQIMLPIRIATQEKPDSQEPIDDVPGVESIARLVGTTDAMWKVTTVDSPVADQPQTIKEGMRLYAGQKLQLTSGYAEFKFFNGAEVVLAGPAVFEVQGKKRCGLEFGKLVARAMERRSKGFTVETPVGQVEDLGTEFGVDVERDGHTNVHVHRGKVELLLAGSTQGHELGTGESGRMGDGGFESTTGSADRFASIRATVPWSPSFRVIHLGNLFDDPADTDLATAIATDIYGAKATVGNLGVERIVYGGNRKGVVQAIAPGVQVNLGRLGWFSTPPPWPRGPANDTTAPRGIPIRTQGKVLKNRANRIEEGIGLHANSFVTFDIDAIRKAGKITRAMPTRFMVTRAGINDSTRTKGSAHLAAIVTGEDGIVGAWVNGREMDTRLVDGAWRFVGQLPSPLRAGKRFVSFDLPLDSRARYLTLISAGDNSWVKNDQAVWSGARIVLTGVPKEERQ